MKTVFFVRHAKSSWADPGLRDIERPLNKRGLRDAPFMGKLLKGKGVKPDRLISSPAKRAFTTAVFFANALGLDATQIDQNHGIYEAYSSSVLDIIRALPDTLNTVMVFGHNPTFTSLANMFTNDYIANVPTCGVFKVESQQDSWKKFGDSDTKLTDFYFPKQYFD